VDSAEITRVNDGKGLFGNGSLSQVLVLEVGVDLGLLGVLGVLKFQLGNVGFSVLDSLVLVLVRLVDFVLGRNQINVDLVDGSLEVGVFGVELFDSLLEISDGLSFLGGELVQSVNHLVSELVQSVNDLPDDSLVAEVLVRSQRNQSFDHGAHSGLGLDLSLDLLQGVLELLDLHH
jgi:hypothetical protein